MIACSLAPKRNRCVASGEAYQFDRGDELGLINGSAVPVRVAHVRLRHSRPLFVRASGKFGIA